MKIKLLVSRCGPAGAFAPGDEIDVGEAEAKRMFEAQPPQAVPVREARLATEVAAKKGK
ncbi:hypothetical protein [Allomesorhizobium camelthorni]|uniref:Uncharacterized protein n=1 Tax=Allomesorhizobium camelthorni TaxID=475069 RepID=A0A6G4WAJ3_9HYPH|nr:hypothetical protein [Mesorhizobium camelthorni]NGO51619.1 hypothetical protein [Mesorhizobium camelthorni]